MIVRLPGRTALAAALLCAAPATAADTQWAPAPVPGTPDTRPVTAERDADPAIWVVRDPDTTIYLFGTIHLLRPGLTWFDEAVKTAYDASDELVIEMVEPDAATTQAASLRLGVDPSGQPLRDKLTPEARATYEAALTSLEVPVAAFDQMRPWLAGMTLSVLPLIKAGFDPAKGVEKTILVANTKPLQGLETLDEQLGFFAGLPEAEQINFLNEAAEQVAKGSTELDGLVDAWAAGDVDAVATLMNEGLSDGSPLIEKVLLTDRNDRWAQWIARRLEEPGTVFLAVGAGHLAGPNSVQAALARDGLTASRIEY